MTDRPRSGRRLDFLDALRGVAVALVLVQHVGERLFPAVREFGAHVAQLGQLGVVLFFLCSGFIIPASLERPVDGGPAARLRSFWRSRFFRLFPLYWASLAGALLLAGLGRGTAVGVLHAGGWLVNATMLQGLLGVPHALGIYWTLTCELVFYLAVSLLYLVLPWPALTAALWITTTVIVATLTHRLVELPAVRLGRTLGARPARTATAGERAVPPLLQFPSASGRPAPRPSLSTAAAGSSS